MCVSMRTYIALLYLLFFIAASFADNPCIPAHFGNESIVCVCNSTYCDTVPRIKSMSSDVLYTYVTSRDGKRFHLTKVDFSKVSLPQDYDVLLTPKPSEKLQTIEGFGGAMTDSSVHVINKLSEGAQNKLLESYFSPRELHYILVRVPIGSTDFSLRVYSYDPYPGDYSLDRFNLTKEEITEKIPMLRKAQRLAGQNLKLMGAAWGAPAWMKTDDVDGPGSIKFSCYNAFAEYHIRFLQAYEKEGFKYWGLSTGNEPSLAAVSTRWTSSSLATWLNYYLGPKISENFPETSILLMDDLPSAIPQYSNVMANERSNHFLYGWAVHPYPLNALINITKNMEYAHQRFPNKAILSTEFTVGVQEKPSVLLGSWSRSEQYGIRIITTLNAWATAWLDWNLALDEKGGPNVADNPTDGPVIIVGPDTFYKQPSFYIQGHFSAFLVPGSSRINFTMVPDEIIDGTTAITPDGNIVIILLNRKENDVKVGIRRRNFSNIHLIVPAKSIITALYKL